MEPTRQLCFPDLVRIVGVSVGRLSNCSLDEALGLAVGLQQIVLGPSVLDAQPSEAAGKLVGSIAAAVVG